MGSRALTRKPEAYQADILDAIVRGKSLRQITKAESMVSIPTIYRWLRNDPEFAQQYARAKEDQADGLADELIDIARVLLEDKDVTHERIQATRTAIDALKWTAGRLRPQRWGDRVTVGGDESNPLKVVVEASPRQELEQYLKARAVDVESGLQGGRNEPPIKTIHE